MRAYDLVGASELVWSAPHGACLVGAKKTPGHARAEGYLACLEDRPKPAHINDTHTQAHTRNKDLFSPRLRRRFVFEVLDELVPTFGMRRSQAG